MIYKTVFRVEVFSEGPFSPDSDDNDPFDLASINYAICEGDCIGDCIQESSEIVPEDQVEAELIRIGNDGSFFQRDLDE